MWATQSIIFLSYFMVIINCLVAGQGWNDSAPNNTSTHLTSTIAPRVHERVLLRRKRFLIFPKGSAVVCTLSMVKALVFKGPRGYNLVAEFDYIYPLPDTVQSLKPKKTNLKAVPPPPPPPPTTTEAIPTFIDDHENHIFYDHPEFSEHHPDVFAPNSGWRVDPNFADLPDVPAGKEIPDGLASDRTWLSQSTNYDPKMAFQPRVPITRYWNDAGSSPLGYSPKQAFKRQRQFVGYPQGRTLNAREAPNKELSQDWRDHEDWEHFESHRDRRDLYGSLAGMISGIDLQPCLLRTICEVQHFLLPQGRSLFHDIFKILFTLPIKDVFNDKYAQAMRASADDCQSVFARDCPISLLHLFLNSQKIM